MTNPTDRAAPTDEAPEGERAFPGGEACIHVGHPKDCSCEPERVETTVGETRLHEEGCAMFSAAPPVEEGERGEYKKRWI